MAFDATIVPHPIPLAAGVGLRPAHLPEFMTGRPDIGWLEAHTENFLAAGGPRMHAFERIRHHYPLSLHGVGLSLGSVKRPDRTHLGRIRALVERVQPALISEHIAWSGTDGAFLNDLLPLPYTEEALAVLCTNVDIVQTALGRRILLENPARYLRFEHSPIPEWEFISELVRRSGCGVLLDVNNVHVSAVNLGIDAHEYLARIPGAAIEEIHVAGHASHRIGERLLLLDDHGHPVADTVWELLERVLRRIGPRPVLVEWDSHIPALETLLAEAVTAGRVLDAAGGARERAG